MVARLFPALLKFWRSERGLSQLDLSLVAGVSARHVAFLECGRANPSADMVRRLFGALDVPLRERNEALRAAGFDACFPEPSVDDLAPPIAAALARMMEKHEPYPLVVLSVDYGIVRANRGAHAVFSRMMATPPPADEAPNLLSFVFDPARLRGAHTDWPTLARAMLSRFQRECLARPNDPRLARKLAEVLAYPGVPKEWRRPDFSRAEEPLFTIGLARGALSFRFGSAVTVFSAPGAVTLEELRIESLFPLDEATHDACERLAREGAPPSAEVPIRDTAFAPREPRSRPKRATRE